MFFNRFAVSIISTGNKIEEILSCVPQPEDSSFEIKTFSRAEDISASGLGSAVIADCTGSNAEFPDTDAEYTVLIVSADNLPDEIPPTKPCRFGTGRQ